MLSKFCLLGFRGPYALYGGKWYEVSLMLFDLHLGQNWYPKPYVRSSFISNRDVVEVKGTFCFVECLCFPSATDPWID